MLCFSSPIGYALQISYSLYQWLFIQLPWRKKRDTNLLILASQDLNILLSCSLSLYGDWLVISELHAFKKPDDTHLSACWHCSTAKIIFSFSRTCFLYIMSFKIFQQFKPVFAALIFPHLLKLLFKDEDKNESFSTVNGSFFSLISVMILRCWQRAVNPYGKGEGGSLCMCLGLAQFPLPFCSVWWGCSAKQLCRAHCNCKMQLSQQLEAMSGHRFESNIGF